MLSASFSEVVICFQFWVSLTSLSLGRMVMPCKRWLWFAFNFEYLWHRYHWNSIKPLSFHSCDLLSILSIFDIAITNFIRYGFTKCVVICFQFWVSLTSLSLLISCSPRLASCDLLSILSIFDIAITPSVSSAKPSVLWFAFNFEYLWHRYHCIKTRVSKGISCDLLSILSIFDIAITMSCCSRPEWWVVICFQFWVSLTSLSLNFCICRDLIALWFAFNFEYLWHRYHSNPLHFSSPNGCDLLSILSIFDIAITPAMKLRL